MVTCHQENCCSVSDSRMSDPEQSESFLSIILSILVATIFESGVPNAEHQGCVPEYDASNPENRELDSE